MFYICLAAKVAKKNDTTKYLVTKYKLNLTFLNKL